MKQALSLAAAALLLCPVSARSAPKRDKAAVAAAAEAGYRRAHALRADLNAADKKGATYPEERCAEIWGLLQKAADAGHAKALLELAELRGEDELPCGKPDPKAEKALLRKAAELGDARGEFLLGRLIARGGDRAGLAAHWYRKAAEQGDADAKQALVDLRASRGPGPKKGREALDRAKECAKARKEYDPECGQLFLAAANEGSAEAQCSVGKARIGAVSAAEFYNSVNDVPEKVESKKKPGAVEGVGWLKMSAEQGYPEAQYLMGGLLEEGTYLEKAPEQAALWYRRAADQGHVKAAEALEKLKGGAQQESRDGDGARAARGSATLR